MRDEAGPASTLIYGTQGSKTRPVSVPKNSEVEHVSVSRIEEVLSFVPETELAFLLPDAGFASPSQCLLWGPCGTRRTEN
jgi:hypothetical protein